MTTEVIVLIILIVVVEVIFWGLLLKYKLLSEFICIQSASEFISQLPFVTKEMGLPGLGLSVWLGKKSML